MKKKNTTCIWSFQRNCYSYNDALQKHEAMVYSLDVDIDFLDIDTGVLQGDRLASYLFTLCLDNVVRMSTDLIKENIFILKRQEVDDIPLKL